MKQYSIKVFVSYRREDSHGIADRVAKRLREAFGQDNVFKDVDSISIGEKFHDKIKIALTEADVLLVVIGPGWLNASTKSGRRRLDLHDDWVRIEILEALHREDVRVVPLLVEGAGMPDERSLPVGLKALTDHQAWTLRPGIELEADLDALCERLDPRPRADPDTPGLRVADKVQIMAGNAGINHGQSALAGLFGSKRFFVPMLAATGVMILTIVLMIPRPAGPDANNISKNIIDHKARRSLRDEDIRFAEGIEALLNYKPISTFISLSDKNVQNKIDIMRDGISRLRNGQLHTDANHTSHSQSLQKLDVILAESMEDFLKFKSVSMYLFTGKEEIQKQSGEVRKGISRLRSGELHSHTEG